MRINNINILKTKQDAFFKHTSWHDQVVEAKGSELKSLLGEPNTQNGREIQYYLLFISTNGYRAITLYNNYGGNDKGRFTKFHIGGDCKEETVIAAECLSTALTYLRARRIKWKYAPKNCKCNINGCFPCEHCFSYKEEENRVLCGKVSEDVASSNKRYTGFTDFKGNPIFECDYVKIPHTFNSKEHIGIVRYDSEMKRWSVYGQPPYDNIKTELAPYIENVNPLVTPAAYKVVNPPKDILELYKLPI